MRPDLGEGHAGPPSFGPAPFSGPPDQPFSGPPDESVFQRLREPLTILAFAVAAVVLVLVISWGSYGMDQAIHRIVKALLGAAIALAFVLRPDWSLALLPLSFAYVTWLPKSPIPMLNAMNVIMFSLAAGWVSRSVLFKKRFLDPSPWNLPMALLLGWILFSWFWSAMLHGRDAGHMFTSFQRVWLENTGLILFFLVYNSVRTMAQVRRLTFFFCVGCAAGLFGLLKQSGDFGGERRVAGGIGQENLAGAFFASVTLFCLGMFLEGFRGFRARVIILGCVIASAIATVLPASRGAYVGFLAGVLPQVVRGGIVWVLMMALGVGGFLLWAPEYARERVLRTQEAATSEEGRIDALNQDAGGRLDFWAASLEIISEHPILGVGYGRMPIALEEKLGRVKAPHNFYLESAGELGIPGLLLLLWLFGIGWWRAGRLARYPGFPRGLAVSYRSLLLCLLVANIFGGRFFTFNMAGLLSFLTALVFRAETILDAEATSPDAAQEEVERA